MNLRDSKTRLILAAIVLGLALIVIVASCSRGDGESDPGAGAEQSDDSNSPGDSNGETEEAEEGGQEVSFLASVTGEGGITLNFTRAEREEGGFLTVEGTMHNATSEVWVDLAWRGAERELAVNGFSMAGATLTAKSEGKRYLVLRDTTGRCLCTGFGGAVNPGETVEWFAQFPAPDPATTEVDFQIGRMPTVTIEIG
ncbi:hypothetical protein GCM10027160_52780 [Streptomyces calidiresistens]|uniref:DUF4352 domain-containing protein n=1 Tax=Streptomyces calidiresistens TaxID=1485586 RepID=A0A7W3T4H5_9ACTN|nr:hypothetical protein [Streptomyces calidiresistens]MBB0230763.1 hypothetical protein [Streptomyces calidiresistens]